MSLDSWISNRNTPGGFYQSIDDELKEEEETISKLTNKGKFWQAFNRLNMLFTVTANS